MKEILMGNKKRKGFQRFPDWNALGLNGAPKRDKLNKKMKDDQIGLSACPVCQPEPIHHPYGIA